MKTAVLFTYTVVMILCMKLFVCVCVTRQFYKGLSEKLFSVSLGAKIVFAQNHKIFGMFIDLYSDM